MTLADYQTYVNKTAILENVLPGLDVAVRILDVRTVFGRTDVKVTPIAGHGDTWVDVKRVMLNGGLGL
jgi:hypothetical protein